MAITIYSIDKNDLKSTLSFFVGVLIFTLIVVKKIVVGYYL